MDFQSTMRRGVKSGRQTMVVYVAKTDDAGRKAGFVVSKAVGSAPARNLVKRRLRGMFAELLPTLPDGTRVVVRALPSAASASYQRLERDATGAVETALESVKR